jgi:hypothetical protein
MKTIEEVAGAYAAGCVAAWKDLMPPGLVPVVRLEDKKGTKKRKDASADQWNPAEGRILVTFAKVDAAAASKSSATQAACPPRIADAIRSLDAAERDTGFVALKWFRDSVLPARGLSWTTSIEARQSVIREAIDHGLFLTYKVSNPGTPAYPTTAIRLKRESAVVQSVLAAGPERPGRSFTPVKIANGPLSGTILRERR